MSRCITLLVGALCASSSSGFAPHARQGLSLSLSSNSDMFGSGSGSSSGSADRPRASDPMKSVASQNSRLMDEAARLRQEAAEMEVSLREEARAKGVPEEMINKLIPIRNPKGVEVDPAAAAAAAAAEAPLPQATAEEVRAKLGYIVTGDALSCTRQLDQLKEKRVCSKWNSLNVPPSAAGYLVAQTTFKSRTSLEPAQLKLDSAGFNYQGVLGGAILTSTILALGSSQIGGQVGFLMGYASALFPVLLVGVGSIAPGLIAEAVNTVTFATNEEARNRHIAANAGKFLCGYLAGLPLSKFTYSGPSCKAEFFQLRPERGAVEEGAKRAFAKQEYRQQDVARCSVACIAGCVAEAMEYKEASGKASGDVNTLYDLMNAVMPPLLPEKQQDHLRWSALTAYDMLTANKKTYKRLCEAFANNTPLEECVAIIEQGEGEGV